MRWSRPISPIEGGRRIGFGGATAGRGGVASVNNPKSPYRKFRAMVITD
jgi:hypothetical protein